MRSNNPVFKNGPFARGGAAGYQGTSAYDLESMYAAPAAGPVRTGRMTLDDVIMKTAAMFAVLLVAAAGAWYLTPAVPFLPFVGMIGGLVLGLVISFKQSTNPAMHLGYAVLEGLFVGGVSRFYQGYAQAGGGDTNIVGQAVLGTLAAFAVMLVLNRTGVLKAPPRFVRMMTIALGAYFVIAIASFVAALFGVGSGWGFYGVGGLGLLLCVAGVALAAFSLVLDFDYIEHSVRAGVPERYSWLAAFGLVVTLVWLYLELLRLLAILQGRD